MQAIKSNGKGGSATATAVFVALMAALCGLACTLGFVRPVDALKSWVWVCLLSVLVFKCLSLFKAKRPLMYLSLWIMFFSLDLAVQGVLRGFFGANPSPSIIAESLSNTTVNESWGFFVSQLRPILLGVSFVILSTGAVFAYYRLFASRMQASIQAMSRWLLGVLCLLTLALHFNPTMLRQEPLLRWPVVYARHLDAQADIAKAKQIRNDIELKQADWKVTSEPGDKTVVLVIGESDNRNNWSWYGYPRTTTSPLQNALSELGGTTYRFKQAKSAQAYTLPALRLALTPATLQQADLWRSSPDVFMLAKAGGYNMTWLSNQVAFEGWLSLLGKSSDKATFVNTGNWRDTASTDFELLPVLNTHLATPKPASKELIVLHLLGQHFHYDLRCPKDAALRPFSNIDGDAVMQSMTSQGRSASIRATRNEYDNAVYCGSELLARSLKSLKANRPGRELVFVYFSDHGQEVGHTQNYAGHSDSSEQGFTVPLFQWHYSPTAPISIALVDINEPYSTEHLDHLIQGALGIKSVWYNAALNPLHRFRSTVKP